MHFGPQLEEVIHNPAHVRQNEFIRHGCTVRSVSTGAGAASYGHKIEDYTTVESGALYQLSSVRDAGNCLAEVLESVLAPFFHQRLCICGLGNADNICDSLGPATIRLLPAMFLEEIDTPAEGRFSKLATLIPNVQDATNLEPEILVAGMVAASEADALVLVDAIATNDPRHLCNNIQISSDGGIYRHAGGRMVNWCVAGVPVISIGVPTLLHSPVDEHGFLTAYRIQEAVSTAAAIIAYALIRVSYPRLSELNCIEAVRLRQTFPLDW